MTVELLSAVVLQSVTAPVEQFAVNSHPMPWGESIADEVMWIGFFTMAWRLGRRYLMGEFLPDEMSAVDIEEVRSDRDPKDRLRAWILYAVGVAATTAGVYLLTTPAWSMLWFGALAFAGAVAALWSYRGGTPVDDIQLLAAARRGD